MKTINTFVLAFLLISFSTFAGNGLSSSAKDYSTIIRSSLSFPKTIERSGVQQKVLFYFSVDEKGNVIEVDAICDNKEVEMALEAQFSQLVFPGLKPKATNSVAVNFVVY